MAVVAGDFICGGDFYIMYVPWCSRSGYQYNVRSSVCS